MKKHVGFIFKWVAVVITVFSIAGCNKDGQANIPDDAKVKADYERAVEAYEWFDLTTMEIDYADSKDYNNVKYNRVKHPTIKTLGDLESYLKTIFSKEISERLIQGSGQPKHYADIDGALYAVDSQRGADITKGQETYEIVRESDKKIIFKVNVEVVDPQTQSVTGNEVHNFTYELVDGKWVFTEFGLVR